MFDKIKESMQRRIERGSIKSELNGEVVYMKKSRIPFIGGDWVQFHPPINEDGSWNNVNLIFGGWRNLRILIVMLVLVAMTLFAFNEVFNSYEALVNLPCVKSCLTTIQENLINPLS